MDRVSVYFDVISVYTEVNMMISEVGHYINNPWVITNVNIFVKVEKILDIFRDNLNCLVDNTTRNFYKQV